jgi:hypothetical protein
MVQQPWFPWWKRLGQELNLLMEGVLATLALLGLEEGKLVLLLIEK